MASFYGYIILLMGISVLLGLAGVDTLAGGIMNAMGMGITSDAAGNVTISGVETFDTLTNVFNLNFYDIIAGLGLIALATLALRFSLGDTLKLGGAVVLFGLMLSDARGIITAAKAATALGSTSRCKYYCKHSYKDS